MDRRSFLKSVGRNALLALLAVLGVVGWRRGKINRAAAGACPSGACRSCGQLASCDRQEAAAQRSELFPKP